VKERGEKVLVCERGGTIIDAYVFVDVSIHKDNTVYAIVVIREDKLSELGRKLKWVKHRRKLGKRERRGYDSAFPRRLARILSSGLLEKVIVVRSLDELATLLHQLKSRYRIMAICIDNRVLAELQHHYPEVLRGVKVKPESEVTCKKGDLRRVMLLADNLASLTASGKL